jgi:hypothetical protein
MSSNLYWRTPNPQGQNFAYTLKFQLREYFGGEYIGQWTQVGPDLIPFLEGVVAGAGKKSDVAKEAQFLIDKIREHGSVEICEVN